MEAFVGLVVRLALDGSDGRIVQGQVAHVNEAHQVLTLSQCSVLQDSVISLHDRLSVRGSEIADLVLVNASTPPLQGRLSSSGKSSSSRGVYCCLWI